MTKAMTRHRVEALEIAGANANNLKHVDVRIPLNRVTVVTGVSSSGTSSLLADTHSFPRGFPSHEVYVLHLLDEPV